jgi:hypothetical protein
MRIEWKSNAAPPTDEEIARFERDYGVRLTDEHRRFLQTVSNGGRPIGAYQIPTTDCPGGAATLHGVYGINHPTSYYDMGRAVLLNPERARRFCPFGYDDVGGELAIDLVDRVGRVVYNPSDPDEVYHSANSIGELMESLTLDTEE